jgi:hypothetical protein
MLNKKKEGRKANQKKTEEGKKNANGLREIKY